MLVKYWMKEDVATIGVNEPVQKAVEFMKKRRLPVIPVMDGERLVGVISDRELKSGPLSSATSPDLLDLSSAIGKMRAGDLMTRHPITFPPDYTLEEAAAQLMMNELSAAPVVDSSGRVLGVISQNEIFLALISLSGFGKRGVQFALLVGDRPGSIKEVTDIIREYGGRLVSILTSTSRAPLDQRYLYIRTYDIDRTTLTQLQEELNSKGILLYVVDHREGTRHEFVTRNR
jgi:acetoin utilization protein AcuB